MNKETKGPLTYTTNDNYANGELKELFHAVGWVRKDRDWSRLNRALDGSFTISVREESNKLLGLCSALSDGLNVVITFLLVDPTTQNQKIGGSMLDIIKAEFNDYRIVVMTEKAKSFYEKNGFELIAHGLEYDSTNEG